VTYRPLGPFLEASDEVREALAAGRPVVALESTIISHGLPYPANLKTAVAVEEVVRRGGAVPATIAIIRGQARVGCDRDDLERLAAGAIRGSPASGSPASGPPIVKASVRDLPALYARGGTGATTVAATATIAAQAGIRVFVTGGIGGVHRGWGETLDISADLEVLGRVSLAVVCSGAKVVLDVAATLEYLETKGVTVVGLGTDRFPGFYLRATPFPVEAVAADPAEAAAIVSARLASGLPGAVLVVVPIPAADELPPAVVETALAAALGEAAARGVTGKDVTPFLLEAMRQATGGRSLGANIALVLNNAAVGAAIAVELAKAGG
jgi:pseudouridine-5'-phosphate glycosidase